MTETVNIGEVCIGAATVKVRDKSWAVGQIKEFGVGPSVPGGGFVFWFIAALCFLISIGGVFSSPIDGTNLGIIIVSILFGIVFTLAGREASKTSEVWIKTSIARSSIFRSKNAAEIEKVHMAIASVVGTVR